MKKMTKLGLTLASVTVLAGVAATADLPVIGLEQAIVRAEEEVAEGKYYYALAIYKNGELIVASDEYGNEQLSMEYFVAKYTPAGASVVESKMESAEGHGNAYWVIIKYEISEDVPPTNPEKPTEPTQPVEPVTPPTEPTTPEKPVEPTTPVEPTQPTQPTTPDKPADKPTDTVTPPTGGGVETSKPTAPATPPVDKGGKKEAATTGQTVTGKPVIAEGDKSPASGKPATKPTVKPTETMAGQATTSPQAPSKTLPATGEAASILSLVGVGLMGLAVARKRRQD